VVVNRVFPEEVEGGYFGAWRAVQREQLELVESGFSPVPVLRAPYFEQEVIGAGMLDRLGAELFAEEDGAAVLHDTIAQELSLDGDGARLRLDLPFAEKGDISLKKIGLELVVRVDGQKRTIILPPALAPYRPASASFTDGALEVSFS
jgi:arsenite-transporting ATPase